MTLQLWKRLTAIGSGHLAIASVNYGFDFLLYPFVIYLLGAIRGGAVMIALALLLNYSLVLFYSRTESDWLGLEWLRLQKDTEAQNFLGRVLRFALKRGDWLAFLLLSRQDPFKAFVFKRGRVSLENGFSRKDWQVFITANLIGNLFWILVVSGSIEVVKRIF